MYTQAYKFPKVLTKSVNDKLLDVELKTLGKTLADKMTQLPYDTLADTVAEVKA